MSNNWPNRGDELLRIPLGEYDLVVEDDGDADRYLLCRLDDGSGGRDVESVLMRERSGFADDPDATDDDFVDWLEEAFSTLGGESNPGHKVTPQGPPPISTLPVTFCCWDCDQTRVRTSLVNPRAPENRWTCEDCSPEDSPYSRQTRYRG